MNAIIELSLEETRAVVGGATTAPTSLSLDTSLNRRSLPSNPYPLPSNPYPAPSNIPPKP